MPLALSVTVSVAVLEPVAAGVKVMEMVQDEPAARVPARALQVSDPSTNSLAFVPLIAMLKAKGLLVPLLSVAVDGELGMFFCWLPKFKAPGNRLTPAGGAAPAGTRNVYAVMLPMSGLLWSPVFVDVEASPSVAYAYKVWMPVDSVGVLPLKAPEPWLMPDVHAPSQLST